MEKRIKEDFPELIALTLAAGADLSCPGCKATPELPKPEVA